MSSGTVIFALPVYLWHLYVDHLWKYDAGSWVGRTASAFRVLALLLIMPLAVLAMLDIASYVIARTLGVIDATKASTSGVAAHDGVPAIHVSAPAAAETEGETESALFRDNPVAEGNPRLAGVDAFSPAPSQPPSPTISRRDSILHGQHQLGLRPMTAAHQGDEGEVGFPKLEDGAEGIQMRRKTRRTDGDDS
ncbi:hypothetical protein PHLGIDRAFT_117264 [Phlebiopsis gigantea 11061_1 CR5-6]|uniref:Uncharacterized protein n=1 Tax=Phlebiopsis gigantea (strain 11061_1 CR5-6) TaxID=745531 RepID=A0A0C3NT37_PHLG1|nr:hypothetical protein PHLGIDRAFT_117264 [Phlebiopsis gigantea 11061_1 CR5-6]